MRKKIGGFLSEFKKFITRGNVLDMAVGVVVGAAFTAIVNSLVKNIINPIVGLATGGIDFGDLKIVLKPASGDIPELAIEYGIFINAIINFLIIALVVFTIVRTFNRIKEQAEERLKREEKEAAAKAAEAAKAAAAAPPKKDPQIELLEEIRDLLEKQSDKGQNA